MERFMMIVIVTYGQAKYIVEAATRAGATGATILHARGVQKPKKGLFQFNIEPEQEIVLIMATKEITEAIRKQLSEDYNKASTIYLLPIKGIEDYAESF